MKRLALFFVTLLLCSMPSWAQHRYWRVYIDADAGDHYVIATEIELRSSVGGSNLATGGTASASSAYGGDVAANAFDGNLSTYWMASGAAMPQWIEYDLGAGSPASIVEIKWGTLSGYYLRTPSTFDVQYSDNDATWTTAWSVYGYMWSDAQNQVFTNPPSAGSHRYWSVYVSVTSSGSAAACAELEFHSTAGGGNIITGGTPTASTVNNGYVAANCFDGNPATFWNSGGQPPQWVGYDFGSGNSVSVEEIKWTSRADYALYNPLSFAMQFSDDGTNWSAAWSQTGISGWTNGSSQTFTDSTLPPPATTVRHHSQIY